MIKTIADAIRTETVNGIEMVRIPKFYSVGSGGIFSLKKPITSATVYPAFIDGNGKEYDCFYVSAYPLNEYGEFNERGKVMEDTYANVLTKCVENEGTIMGYWEFSALLLLAGIDFEGKSIFGQSEGKNDHPSEWRGLKRWNEGYRFSHLKAYQELQGRNASESSARVHALNPNSPQNPPSITDRDVSGTWRKPWEGVKLALGNVASGIWGFYLACSGYTFHDRVWYTSVQSTSYGSAQHIVIRGESGAVAVDGRGIASSRLLVKGV